MFPSIRFKRPLRGTTPLRIILACLVIAGLAVVLPGVISVSRSS